MHSHVPSKMCRWLPACLCTTPQVIDLNATDANAEQSLTYSIVGGNDGHFFYVDPAAGAVYVSRDG